MHENAAVKADWSHARLRIRGTSIMLSSFKVADISRLLSATLPVAASG